MRSHASKIPSTQRIPARSVRFEESRLMRILVVIASFGSQNDVFLERVIAEYQSMPHAIDIVVVSNIQKNLGPAIEVCVGLPDEKNPHSLPFAHRTILAERANDYDLFMYSEDDILITARNIEAFFQQSAVLPSNYVPGFLRFEEGPSGKIQYCDIHAGYSWDTQSVEMFGELTFAFFSNEHAGCYILTHPQLLRALDSGGFLLPPHHGIYGMLESAATDPFTQCGMRKMICISRIDDASVHHLPNKYFNRFGLSQSDLRAQIEALLQIGKNGRTYAPLIRMAPGLRRGRFLRDHYGLAKPEVLSLIPEQANDILSFGCGETEIALARGGKRVVSIPVDPVVSAPAAQKGIDLVIGDFESAIAQLQGQSFDCLLMLDVLHLIDDPVHVLSSLIKFLRPDGTIIALTPYIAGMQFVLGWLAWKEGKESYRKAGVNLTSPLIVRQWLRRAGAVPESVVTLSAGKGTPAGLVSSTLHLILSRQFIIRARRSAHSN